FSSAGFFSGTMVAVPPASSTADSSGSMAIVPAAAMVKSSTPHYIGPSLDVPTMTAIDDYITSHRQAFVDDLSELLRIPSVSADSHHNADTRRAADWVAAQFRDLNLKTELIETDGYPLVYAETPSVPGKPIALIYGHYDVQPPDPL